MADDDVTNVYDFLDALGQTIASSDPAKRELLAPTIDAYSNDFPDDFYWSISWPESGYVHKRVGKHGSVAIVVVEREQQFPCG